MRQIVDSKAYGTDPAALAALERFFSIEEA
jgi:hypothetical protein